MQAGFMPAVAISFSAAAVVGQNYGARAYARVRETALESIKLVLWFMLFFTGVCQILLDELVSLFSPAGEVVAAGVDYLEVVSWGYFASGIMFVSAGVFQGLGNTWPSLLSSGVRTLAFTVPVLVLSSRPGFRLHAVWLVWLVTAIGQLALQLFLLRRELALKAPSGVPTVVT